ncbi:MAG TPA: DMT family transporter [bacterium]|nr:DMT family transporter [bacterium]
MGVIAGLLSMLFWGTAIFLSAFATRKVGNVLTLLWMQIFGFLIALIYFLFTFNSFSLNFTLTQLLTLLAIAILQLIAYLAFYKGLEKGEVSLVSPIAATWGLIVTGLGLIFLNEVLNSLQILAIVLIISGVLLLSTNIKALFTLKKVNLTVGVKEGIIAMLGWGISLFLLAIISKELGWFLPTLIFRFFVLVMLSVYILSTTKSFRPTKKGFPLVLVGVGIFDVAGFFAYSLGTASSNASLVAPIGSAFALVSVILAVIFLKEKLTLQKSFGIISIALGLVLLSI